MYFFLAKLAAFVIEVQTSTTELTIFQPTEESHVLQLHVMYDKYKNKKKQSIWVAGLHSSSAPMLRVLKKKSISSTAKVNYKLQWRECSIKKIQFVDLFFSF